MSMYYNRLWSQKRRDKPGEGGINCVDAESRARGDCRIKQLLDRLDEARYPSIFGLDNHKIVSIVSIGDTDSVINHGYTWGSAESAFTQTCDLLYERFEFLIDKRHVTPIFIQPPEPVMPTDKLISPVNGAIWNRDHLRYCRETLNEHVIRRLGALTIDFPGGPDEPWFMSYDQMHMSSLGYAHVFPVALRLVEATFEREVDESLLNNCIQHLNNYVSLCIGSGLCSPEVVPGA